MIEAHVLEENSSLITADTTDRFGCLNPTAITMLMQRQVLILDPDLREAGNSVSLDQTLRWQHQNNKQYWDLRSKQDYSQKKKQRLVAGD